MRVPVGDQPRHTASESIVVECSAGRVREEAQLVAGGAEHQHHLGPAPVSDPVERRPVEEVPIDGGRERHDAGLAEQLEGDAVLRVQQGPGGDRA